MGISTEQIDSVQEEMVSLPKKKNAQVLKPNFRPEKNLLITKLNT
jgi:hypothetical protein